ncbi:MAG: hypothetical protein LBT64_01260, partial [Puniceicoccales bacterium]|nr:hypothetical protein [Puniceicoccales bacterium]
MIGFTGWYADLQKEKARLRAEHEVREAARKEANTGVRIAHGEVYINPGGGSNSCRDFPSVRILAARSKLRDKDPVVAKGKSLNIYRITVGRRDLSPLRKVNKRESSGNNASPARVDEHRGDVTNVPNPSLRVDGSTSPMEIFCAISTGGILQRTLCSETQMANEGSETQQIHEDDAHAPAEVSAESVANEATENVVSGAEAAENFSDVGANQSAKESNIQLESLSEPLAQVKKEKSTSELLSSESFAT